MVKGKFGKTSKSLKILWKWRCKALVRYPCAANYHFFFYKLSVQKQWGMKFCDPCWGLLHRVDSRMEYLFAYQFWYWELWVENLWGGERKHYFGNVGRWGLVRLVLYTSLHQSCTYSLPTLHIYSTSNRRHIWNLVEHVHHELFCRNSQRVKVVGYFRRRAPSCIFDRMFDRILNGTLPNNLL